MSVHVSQSYTSTFSFDYSHQRNAFSAGVSVGASWSNTYTRSDTVTQPVSPGHYAWMDYIPYMDNSLGTLYEDVWFIDQNGSTKLFDDVTWIEVFIAKDLFGIPDGIYTIMEDTVLPTH